MHALAVSRPPAGGPPAFEPWRSAARHARSLLSLALVAAAAVHGHAAVAGPAGVDRLLAHPAARSAALEAAAEDPPPGDPPTEDPPPDDPPPDDPPPEDPPPDDPPPDPPPPAEVHHVIAYGQSMSVGFGALPVLGTVPQHDSLMFAGGVRTPALDDGSGATYGSFLPLVESEAAPAFGETPVAATFDFINELGFAASGVSAADDGIEYLGSAPGEPGRTLAQLGPRSMPMRRLGENIRNGHRLAAAAGKVYRLQAVTWTQGEADYRAGTPRATYAAGLETLRTTVDWLVTFVTGEPAQVPLIIHQTASHVAAGRSYPFIALAQVDAAAAHPHIHLATPVYMMDYAADGVHLTAESSRWLGAWFGLVYRRVVVERGDWQPLQPLSATAYYRYVRIRFLVPVPPLVLDTSQVSNPGSYGFQLVDANGVNLPLSRVALVAPDAVGLLAAQPVPAGAFVRYAFRGSRLSGRFTGPRGNLRDSQGDALVFDPAGLNKPMHNWCVLFELPVTSG